MARSDRLRQPGLFFTHAKNAADRKDPIYRVYAVNYAGLNEP